MSRWKLFSRSRSKKENEQDIDVGNQKNIPADSRENVNSFEERTNELEQETEKTIAVECHETLYSMESSPKKGKQVSKIQEEPWKRKSWENAQTIESNVDSIDKRKMDTYNRSNSYDVSKKVDNLLAKKKKK